MAAGDHMSARARGEAGRGRSAGDGRPGAAVGWGAASAGDHGERALVNG
jgi:hypothetical protein